MVKRFVDKFLDFLSNFAEGFIEKADEKIVEFRKKAMKYIIVYGLFFCAVIFILTGLIKYLAEIGVFYSEGIAYMVFGSVIIVILAAYSLIARV